MYGEGLFGTARVGRLDRGKDLGVLVCHGLGLLDPDSGNPLHPPVYACSYVEDASAVGEDGCVPVPDGPGLGVSYDWDRLYAGQADVTVFRP